LDSIENQACGHGAGEGIWLILFLFLLYFRVMERTASNNFTVLGYVNLLEFLADCVLGLYFPSKKVTQILVLFSQI
jgi:hypothetical protein